MITPLRKRHKLIWILLSPVLAIILILAIVQRPGQIVNDSLSEPEYSGLSIVQEFENDGLKVNLKGENSKVELLEIILKKPLKAASSEIRSIHGNREIILGQIGSTGTYRFEIGNRVPVPEKIQIFDYIRKVELNSIVL